MASRRPPDNQTSRSSTSFGQPKKAQWYTLAQWAANRSPATTEASLSSTILKTSAEDSDVTRSVPSEPESSRRQISQTRRPRKGDDSSSSLRRRESAEVNQRREESSSSATPPPKTPRHEHGQAPEPPPPSPATPTGDPRGPAVQGSFWSRPYLRGEHSTRPLGRVSSPASMGGQSFRTLSHTRDDSSRHAGPVDSPGPSGRQSFQAAPYLREDSPWRRSPGPSTSSSRQRVAYSAQKSAPKAKPSGNEHNGARQPEASPQRIALTSSSRLGVAHSAKKSAPKAKPSGNEHSGARQAEASPQRSTASRSTRYAASTSFRPEEPLDKSASTSTGRIDNGTEAEPAAYVGGTSEQLGQASASRPSGQLAPQQGAIKKARIPVVNRVLREIKRLQAGTRNLIPRRAFAKVVREMMQRHGGRDLNMQSLALEALQEASEMVLLHVLQCSNIMARNARRATIMPRDMASVLQVIRNYGNLQLSVS